MAGTQSRYATSATRSTEGSITKFATPSPTGRKHRYSCCVGAASIQGKVKGAAMEELNYWRWCDELSIAQAALLAVGIDPSSEEGSFCENWKPHERPHGYEAAKSAISNALRKNKIAGTLTPLFEYDINGNRLCDIEDSIDIKSMIEVDSLLTWFISKGLKPAFFFPLTTGEPDYLHPKHPRYSPKLAAAVGVWQAMEDENLLRGKPVLTAMSDWLETRYKELGLTWKGEINNTAVAECAKIANWKTDGGATKTPE